MTPGESVEQAALRRAGEPTDWTARANREAAAIIDGMGLGDAPPMNRAELIGVLAIAWLQGVNLGSHETLSSAERAFDRLRGRAMTPLWVCLCGARNRLRDTACRHCGTHKP